MPRCDGTAQGSGSARILGGPPDEVTEPLTDLNRRCLDLLAEQARTQCTHVAVQRIAALWSALDGAARGRAAGYPYLLFDAGFTDPHRWRRLDGSQINDGPSDSYTAFFTIPQALSVARLVFVYAWSVARHHHVHARLALGMHPQCARRIAAHNVLWADQLAEQRWVWLRPRWPHKLQIWEELLAGAAQGGAAQLRARMYGMQLLTAEIAAAMHSRERPAAARDAND